MESVSAPTSCYWMFRTRMIHHMYIMDHCSGFQIGSNSIDCIVCEHCCKGGLFDATCFFCRIGATIDMVRIGILHF